MKNDDGIENIVLGVAAMILVPLMLPVVLPQLREWLQQRLLEWHVVVPSAEAIVSIPGTSVGLDLARLLLLAALLLGAIALGGRAAAGRGQS